MYSINIADRLWFEETLLGATLNFQLSEGPRSVLFRVGISFRSLHDCDDALGRRHCSWVIRDGSLSIEGDVEELTLGFSGLADNRLHADVLLHGDELKAFRYAVNALAARQRIGLN